MADPTMPGQSTDTSAFARVRDGMHVYDNKGDKIGEVAQVFFGKDSDNIESGVGSRAGLAASEVDSGDDNDAFDTTLETVRNPGDSMPSVLRNRLEEHGFIRVETGMFQSDLYALPNQVDAVAGDRVNLNVSKDQLIKK